MKCPVCGRETDELFSAVKNGKFMSDRCEKCVSNFTGTADYARKYERDRQREDYRKDILQRFDGDKPDRDFIRAYPQKAREYWDEETLRKYE